MTTSPNLDDAEVVNSTRPREITLRSGTDEVAAALRIDPQLWAQIERLAAAELRSANAQVEYLLREALRARTGKAAGDASAPKRAR